MGEQQVDRSPAGRLAGWWGIAALLGGYVILFSANLWLPLTTGSSYTMRLWDWSLWALCLVGLLMILQRRSELRLHRVLLALGLGLLTVYSASLGQRADWELGAAGFGVWIGFLAADLLADRPSMSIAAFRPPLASIGSSLGRGMLLAVPLALINNFFFFATKGAPRFQDLGHNALEALRPALLEEIIFRWLLMALVIHCLPTGLSSAKAQLLVLAFGVLPHSLNHLPDLFLENPRMGLAMLGATSLLFGLPMALLQLRRNLETAIAFHWLIDFARFFFGY